MAVCTGGQWAQAGTGWLIQWPETTFFVSIITKQPN